MVKNYNTIVLVLFVSVLLAGSVAEGAYVLYDDFSSGNLSKWNTGTSNAWSIVSGELVWGVNGHFEVAEVITSKSSWDGSSASVANPLGVSVDLSDFVHSPSTSLYNQIQVGFVTSGAADVFVGKWSFKDALTPPTNDEASSVYDGSAWSASWVSASLYLPDDKIILEYDGTNVYFKRDRNGTITTLRTATANYSGSLTDLHAKLIFRGPNNSGASVTLDNVNVVPEPATMVLLGLGGVGLLIRRRRRS